MAQERVSCIVQNKGTNQQDNKIFVKKLRERIDRVNITLPEVEIRYEQLRVDAEAYLGGRALPTLLNATLNTLESFMSFLKLLKSKKKPVTILKGITGVMKPGRMTLLLGPPGAGKTTLLLALAGKLDKSLKVSGKVTYNGHSMREFVPQRTSVYISQKDLHIGEMTVRETMDFSARCQGSIKPDPDIDFFMKAIALEGQKSSILTDYILKEVCAAAWAGGVPETMVGDDMRRGISGGQKKCVTTGEMMVGPSTALLMDEISTGLDSSTTFQVVNCLRQFVHVFSGSLVASLLQPAPETYDLFDDIILLCEVQVVYHGPRESILDFFHMMGFRCLERKGVADFLQEDQEQYWFDKNQRNRYIPVQEFADAFQSFHVGREMQSGLSVPYDKSKCHPAALVRNKYGLTKMELFKACFDREVLLMKRSAFIFIFKAIQIAIVATMTTTVFLRTEMGNKTLWDGSKYMGVLFFGLVNAMFNGLAELQMTIVKLPVFYKQRDAKFFRQFFLLFNLHQMSLSLFRFIGALGRNQIISNTFGAFALLVIFVLGGFIVSRGDSTTTNGMKEKKGMVLPFKPLALAFKEIKYFVDMPAEMKAHGEEQDRLQLLQGVSGSFRPGVLTCLMGVRGAGKTSLMDVLAEHKTGGYIEGSISISGYSKKQETFARISGYCEQNDIHSPNLTVHESLLFSAWLRLPADVQSHTRKAFVEEVMELVELNNLREALVGVPGVNGLSTEQRKRLTIGPTSGLDARAAAIVMRTVRNAVDTGRTVVCTIHQPSIDICESFDELFLMKRGGQVIYAGPLGTNSQQLTGYFQSIEGVPEITSGYNPATWMLEVTSIASENGLQADFANIYANSPLYERNMALIEELSKPTPGSQDLHFETQFSQPFMVQAVACLWTQHWSYWRNPQYNAVRFFFTLVAALLFGSIFWDMGSKIEQQQDFLNAMGSMFSAVLFLGVNNASSVQPVVDIERSVFYRERAAGMFSALPYALAQVLVELPYVFVQTAVYGVVFLWLFFFMFFTFLYYTYYGMMTVALTPNSIPGWWRWYYWGCPVTWTLYGLMVSQFGNVTKQLLTAEGNPVSLRDFLNASYGFDYDMLPWVACVVVGYAILFALVFALSIRTLNFQAR
ncbi:hypothetical protein AMTRI_Chr12g234470 [Amborella trichopoda]